jgi:hypothetical protein
MAKGGKQPGAGRPPGAKNKLPRDIKARVMAVWEQLEGQGKGLYEEAEKEPQWFYTNFVKPMLPKDVVIQGDEDNPLITEIVIKHVKPDA